MNSATAQAAQVAPMLFSDGLGDRALLRDAQSGEILEILNLRAELTAVPSFEFALSERMRQLKDFDHPAFGRLVRLDRLPGRLPRIGLVFRHTPGLRLSEVLADSERMGVPLDVNAALGLVRQIIGAVAGLHQQVRDASHGALGPERIVIAAFAKPVIVEHALGSALEQLRFPHDRYWKEMRVAVPSSAGSARFDHRADVAQLGMIALALIMGRPLREDEQLRNVNEVLAGATQSSKSGERTPVAPALRSWLTRALQIDLRQSFSTAVEAQQGLNEVLKECKFRASCEDSEAFMARHSESAPALRQVSPVAKAPAPSAATDRFDTVTRGPWGPANVQAPKREGVAREKSKPAAPIARRETPRALRTNWNWGRMAMVCLLLTAFGGGGLAAAGIYESERLNLLHFYDLVAGGSMAIFKRPGTLVVESRPNGVDVAIDGESRGVTPLTLSLKPGSHVLELHTGGQRRVIPVTVLAGAHVSHYVELRPTPSRRARVATTRPKAEPPAGDPIPKTVGEPEVLDLSAIPIIIDESAAPSTPK